MRNIGVSVFSSITSVVPTVRSLPFAQLSEVVAQHRVFNERDRDVPLFSPAVFNGTRSKANVVSVQFGVLDIDDISDSDVVERLMPLAEPYAYILYSTWSHSQYQKKDRSRLRLVVPFTRPVLPNEWPAVWTGLVSLFGGWADRVVKDASRVYWIPAVGTEGELAEAVYLENDGEAVDVDRLMLQLQDKTGASTQAAPSPDRTQVLTVTDLQDLSGRLRRRASGADRTIGYRLGNVARGDAFASPGERDTFVYRLVCAITDEYPAASEDSLVSLFRPSLAVMAQMHPDAPTIDDLRSKIRRRHNALDTEAVSAAVAEATKGRSLLERAGRVAPYTEDEAARFARDLGVDRRDLDSLWVLQRDRSYWVLQNGRYYGPYTPNEVVEVAEVRLAPAASLGVTVNPEDGKRYNPSELVAAHGTVLDDVRISLSAQHPLVERAVDQSGSTSWILHEAPCPTRAIKPAFSREIDQWLRCLAGDMYDKLQDWLSLVTDLERPCTALVLIGAGNSGKSVLPFGLSRIWTTSGPTAMALAMGQYNAEMAKCPLVFADEQVPEDSRGNPRTQHLRRFIQERTRHVDAKYVRQRTLTGCVRVVIAANNDTILASRHQELTREDVDAIVDRFLVLRVGPAAASYLAELGPARVQEEWVDGDGLAAHALWLAQTRVVSHNHRYLVPGNPTDLTRSMLVASGVHSGVCTWLVSYLLDPGPYDRGRGASSSLVRVVDSVLWVSGRVLLSAWNTYETHIRNPTQAQLTNALQALSFDKRRLTDGTSRAWFWAIDTENLIQWAESNAFATRQFLENALVTLSGKGQVELPPDP